MNLMNLVKENKFSSCFVYKHLTSLEKIKVVVLSKYRFKSFAVTFLSSEKLRYFPY